MACGMANPKTFNNIDGVPIKYGQPGAYSQINVQSETSFWSKLVGWKNEMQSYAAYGGSAYSSINSFGHAGFYTCKAGKHGEGRAMDLNAVYWNGGSSTNLFGGDHASSNQQTRRRYLSVDATCRRTFKFVLDGWYNSDHANHIHQDDTSPVSFQTSSSSDVKFLQATLNNFNGSSLAVDGAWGSATLAQYNIAKGKLGMSTDIWASASAYQGFLQSVALKGLWNQAF